MTMFPLLLAAALSAGNAEFDRSAVQGARSVALRLAETRIAENGPASGKMRLIMLDKPKDFERAEQAKEDCRVLYRTLLDAELAGELVKIEERLGLAKTPVHVGMSDSLAAEAMTRFDAYYAAERKAACEEQAKTIVAATHPTEAEFDAKPEETLRKEMIARIASEQSVPVFEENLGYISEQIVEPVLASARKERQRQADYLMRARSEAVAPSKLAEDLKARLGQNLAERAKNGDVAEKWGVFPSVLEKSLPAAVERRTVERLVTEIETVSLAVEADEVMETILKNPEAHAKSAESAKAFTVAYSAEVLANALETAVAGVSEADRAEFKEYLSARLSAEAVTKAVERLVKRDVMPRWKEVRKTVSERFAAQTWPALADGTWYPAAELADDLAARGDFAAVVKGWRKLEPLRDLAEAPRGAAVMEESAELADGRIAAAFERARNAVTTQSAIVDEVHPEVLETARRRKESFFRRTPDLRAITGLLTEATLDAWRARRIRTLWPEGELPENAAEQHRDLFPSVVRKIDLVARTVLEEMNEPRPEAEPKEPDPETPEDTPPEDPPEEEPVFTIEINRGEKEIEVSLKSGEKVVEHTTVAPRKDEFEKVMYGVTRTLSSDILKLK